MIFGLLVSPPRGLDVRFDAIGAPRNNRFSAVRNLSVLVANWRHGPNGHSESRWECEPSDRLPR